MGGAASAQLDSDQISLLTSALKSKYEEFAQEGKSDEELQQLLTAEYIGVLSAESQVDGGASSATSEVEKNKTNKEKDANSSKIAPQKGRSSPAPGSVPGRPDSRENDGKNSRRSSFENDRNNKERSGGKENDGTNSRRGSFGDVEKNTSQKGSAKIGLGRGSGKRGGTGSGKVVGTPRRRSFDDRRVMPQNKAKPNSNGITDSASAPTVSATISEENSAEPAEQASQLDSWDSVSTQPYCAVCKMAFKSIPFLERHVKYSDVHAKNVKMAEEEAAGPIMKTNALPTTESGKLSPKQVEGEHYKLMYSGSKLFWRTQQQVDLNFYHHILPHTIEVIGYDSTKGKEMERIYLNYTRLEDNVKDYHKAFGLHEDEVDKAQHEVLSRYILQRLQLQAAATVPTPGAGAMSKIVFVKLSSDGYEVSPVLEKPPIVLVPVPVTRRRRTNAEEISATMESLASDRAALVEATWKAQKVANLVYTSATSIAEKKWWADFSPLRRKWIWAIRRVIRQKLVAETKANLHARELAKGSSSSSKGNRRQQLQNPIRKTNSREI